MSDEMEEIWQLFADEGGQSLDTAEEILLVLKESPTGQADVGGLFRAMHTFKGNSRVLGLKAIESRAHLAEDLIGLVRDDGVPLGPELLELLVETVDALRGMLETTLTSRRDAEEATNSELADRMRAMFDRCKGGGAPQAPVESPSKDPAQEIARDPEPELKDAGVPETPDGLVFDPVPRSSLAEDSMYREIFSDMARNVLVEMRREVETFPSDPDAARSTLTSEAERLRFAAEQIGLREWSHALGVFSGEPTASIEQAQSLITQLTAMLDRDFGAGETAFTSEEPAPVFGAASDDLLQAFFEALAPKLAAVLDADGRSWRGQVVDGDAFVDFVDDIAALCEPMGFERLARAARALIKANGNSIKFRRNKFRLYEELATITASCPQCADRLSIRPLADLQAWCAESVSKILLDIHSALDWIRVGPERRDPISDLLRFVFHACGYHKLEMAEQLSMSLLDLFARAEIAGAPPDPVLQHITRSFVAVMELVFDAANAGGTPDMAAVEVLFHEAATATFASSSHIEARLDLPKAFHNLLSPESVQTALTAMHAGRRFYIVRADINADDALATAFLTWVGSGEATVITSVTVFQGDTSLFDFLLASALNETALIEALSRLDPGGSALKIEVVLKDRDANAEKDAVASSPPKPDAGGMRPDGMPARELSRSGCWNRSALSSPARPRSATPSPSSRRMIALTPSRWKCAGPAVTGTSLASRCAAI